MVSEWLTPLQATFFSRFFATDTGQRFFLTGGTALAAFHLHHRLSVDPVAPTRQSIYDI